MNTRSQTGPGCQPARRTDRRVGAVTNSQCAAPATSTALLTDQYELTMLAVAENMAATMIPNIPAGRTLSQMSI